MSGAAAGWPEHDAPIDRVRVFRRGAEVERRITLRGDESRFVVRGLPLELDDGSVRLELLDAGRAAVRSIRVAAELVGAPEDPLHAEPEELRSVRRSLREIALELEELRARHARAASLSLPERPARDHGRPPPPAPDRARLELLELRTSALREARERTQALERDKRALERTLRRLSDAHARRTADAPSRHRAQKALHVELEREGEAGTRLVLVYRVRSARWAPSYRLSYDGASKRARLAMRAVVAQRTGEDWRGVAISVSTARLDGWYDLPELASLRIGRAQPPPRRGFRALPADGAALFDDHDRALVPAPAPPQRAPASFGVAPPGAPVEAAMAMASMTMSGARQSPGGPPPPPPQAGPVGAPMPARAPAPSAAAPPAPAAPPAAFAPQARAKSAGMLAGLADALGGGGAPWQGALEEEALAPGEPPAPTVAPLEPSPAGALLDYGSLRLGAPNDDRRGSLWLPDTLARARESGGDGEAILAALARASAHEAELARLAAPAGHTYPEALVGFDFQYDAATRADVPSDGAFHTLAVTEAEGPATLVHVTVPREEPSAYRVLELSCPLEGAVLRGPVDVYLDGSLAVSASLAPTPAGGALQVGMGVDESIKVARNVRFREESAGLMGGSTSLVHELEIELRNNSAAAARVEVRERLPVLQKGEEEIELRPGRTSPPWQDLVQEDPPLDGGKRWIVELASGQQLTLAAEYAIRISAKNELVGGNRRD
jgi:hypothetical protein